MRALIIGFAVTGNAVARHLMRAGAEVAVADDRVDPEAQKRAGQLGLTLLEAPSPGELKEIASQADLVVLSPGVPESHPIFAVDVPIVSELELAGRAGREMDLRLVAVTGTNGKTTVTTLVTEILKASGINAVAAGNIGIPLIETLDAGYEVAVVEASSFQLANTERFRPHVATWLNLAEDHLDWHRSMASYVAAKARIWANQGAGDVTVANWDDQVVRMHAARSNADAKLSFGSMPTGLGLHFHERNGYLWAPCDERIIAISDLRRSLPHDRLNALAAAATAMAVGGSVEACARVLSCFEGLPHRLALVKDQDGVRWYDDSKSTTPASLLAAVAGFDSVVLIAGGRNKGLDLSGLAKVTGRLRGVVAIGEAAEQVSAAIRGARGPEVQVLRAASMHEAVCLAGSLARSGDAVLLSPGCSSFDWYQSYEERGDHFSRLVRALEVA